MFVFDISKIFSIKYQYYLKKKALDLLKADKLSLNVLKSSLGLQATQCYWTFIVQQRCDFENPVLHRSLETQSQNIFLVCSYSGLWVKGQVYDYYDTPVLNNLSLSMIRNCIGPSGLNLFFSLTALLKIHTLRPFFKAVCGLSRK